MRNKKREIFHWKETPLAHSSKTLLSHVIETRCLYLTTHFYKLVCVKMARWARLQSSRTNWDSFLLTKRLYGDLNFSHHFIHCVLMYGFLFDFALVNTGFYFLGWFLKAILSLFTVFIFLAIVCTHLLCPVNFYY